MVVSFLKILIFSFVSIGMGFLAALALRERYNQLYPEGEKNEEDIDENEPVVENPIEEATEQTEVSPEEAENAGEAESEIPTEPETVSVESETATEPAEGEKAEEEEVVSPPKSADPFDDQGLLPKSFKVDSIIDDMLNESAPEVPEDLSAVIDLENTDLPDYTDSFEDPDDGFGADADEDMLARAMENAGTAADSPDEPIDFNDENFLDRVAEETHMHREISPMAVELLGEDFNFDSLMADGLDVPPEAVGAETVEPQIAFREWEDGTFQAESECYTDDLSLLDLLPGEQDIVSAFPKEWVQDEVIEPDHSEEAQKMSFIEDSRPMFVRKTKKRLSGD